MHIELSPANGTTHPAVLHLLQFYLYENSHLLGLDVDAQGRFHAPSIDASWTQEDCQPFLIRVEGRIGGVVLVGSRSRLSPQFDGHAIEVFFVLPRYRAQGIGQAIAKQLFDRFPGRWEVATFAVQVPAQAFWRSVIDQYTAGHYEEHWQQTDTWRGHIQSFSSPGAH